MFTRFVNSLISSVSLGTFCSSGCTPSMASRPDSGELGAESSKFSDMSELSDRDGCIVFL
jgi:hypothetical protein